MPRRYLAVFILARALRKPQGSTARLILLSSSSRLLPSTMTADRQTTVTATAPSSDPPPLESTMVLTHLAAQLQQLSGVMDNALKDVWATVAELRSLVTKFEAQVNTLTVQVSEMKYAMGPSDELIPSISSSTSMTDHEVRVPLSFDRFRSRVN